MRRLTLPLALTLAGLLGLLVAAPASAATTGTLCGEVTAFTAPTLTTDGSITIDGTVETIDSSAVATISAGALTTLAAVAAMDATTCLDITADSSGEIVDLEIAAQAEVCGTVAADTTLGTYSVDGVTIPAALVAADAELAALLDAAARADAALCADVTLDATTGLITTVSVTGTLTLCGTAVADADSVTVGGVDVPLALLDAEARAALSVAIDAGAELCLAVVIDETDLVQANLSVAVDLCGEVTLDAGGDVVVDGVVVPGEVLDANAEALLRLAAAGDGVACVGIDAVTTGGDTSVGVTTSIEVCAEVTAIGDGTITIGDVTFVFTGAAEADIAVGDTLCFAASASPTGDLIITDPDTTDGGGDAAPGAGGGGDAPLLPDTAVGAPATPQPVGWLTLGALVLAAIGLGASRRARARIG